MGICISVSCCQLHQTENCNETEISFEENNVSIICSNQEASFLSQILDTEDGNANTIEFDSNANAIDFGKNDISTEFQKGCSICSKQGNRGVNQDAAIFCQDYGMKEGVFCGVFDGHGKNGHMVSNIVKNRLPSLLLNQRKTMEQLDANVEDDDSQDYTLDRSQTDIEPSNNFHKWREAVVNAFKVMDKEIKLHENLDSSSSGTTAVAVVRQGQELVIANLGDSRAVLGRITEDGIKAIQLTTDLRPSLPNEAHRIVSFNGRVMAVKEEPHVKRVWLPSVDSPGLAMSRAFGDFILKNHGVISVPEISYRCLSPNDKFIVLATDGVWDVLTNNQVASIVNKTKIEEEAAEAVVEAAIAAWKRRIPTPKIDDCTVVCLFLQKGRDKQN